MLTVDETAARLDISPERVRWLCRHGRFPGARKHGIRVWLIPEAAVVLYEAERLRGRVDPALEDDRDSDAVEPGWSASAITYQ